MNGQKIEKMNDVAPFIQKAGKTGESLDLLIKRDKQKIKTKLIPEKDEGEGKYRIGLYIRDSLCRHRHYDLYEPKTKIRSTWPRDFRYGHKETNCSGEWRNR